MKKLKLLSQILYGLTAIILLTITVIVALSAFDIPNGFKIYTVQSNSMSPAIPVGSVIVIRPYGDYKIGDVITYKPEEYKSVKNPKETTTHRIVEVKPDNNVSFKTRGDANNAPDSTAVSKDLVLGKVVFSLPYLGYPVSFAKTQAGFILLVAIPPTVIIYSEAVNIKNEAKRLIDKKKKNQLTEKVGV